MKRIILFIAVSACTVSLQAQTCTLLGCAKNYGVINTADALMVSNLSDYSCITETRQFYWQFVYSRYGGDYTQTFTAPAGKNLDWAVWDMGSEPLTLADMTCPIDPMVIHNSPLTWYAVGCDNSTTNPATGPGIEMSVPTLAYHYYAIAVAVWSSGNWSFTVGTPQLGGSDLTAVNCSGLLPVKLESFDAAKQDNNIIVNWKISREINVSYYEVEYSTDGRNFNTAGKITAGNSNSYSFTHRPQQAPGTAVYYRLKTVDFNGAVSYSAIITIQLNNTSGFYITANPVNDYLNVSGLNNRGQLKIIDVSGKVLFEKNVQAQSLSINVSFIKQGIYFLRYDDGTNAVTRKFLKQ